MEKSEYKFFYDLFDSIEELEAEDKRLVNEAKEMVLLAYAPYSHFRVGTAAELVNGRIVGGSNQENASFPAGLCAERVLLASISSLFPDIAIRRMAITYRNAGGTSGHPIFPCGLCRQSLVEYEQRVKLPIRLILAGETGKVCIVSSVSELLPLAFTGDELK
jgi:cytidine deaminase